MKETSPTEAKKAAEWMKYRDGAHYANVEGLIHALGLHRDPTRGRTHIVFRSLKYTPKASDDVRYKLSVIQAGVFKLTDVYIDIEKIMRLNRGEGKEYVDGLLAELDSVLGDNVPILDLMSCGDLQPWLRNQWATPAPLQPELATDSP